MECGYASLLRQVRNGTRGEEGDADYAVADLTPGWARTGSSDRQRQQCG